MFLRRAVREPRANVHFHRVDAPAVLKRKRSDVDWSAPGKLNGRRKTSLLSSKVKKIPLCFLNAQTNANHGSK